MTRRKIIRIDEQLCDGCGLCVTACAEGAIRIVDGKARLVSDTHCDGLGACLGECPRGALRIEEREAEAFDEALTAKPAPREAPPGGCPSARLLQLRPAARPTGDKPMASSALSHWPIKLRLVPPKAPFLRGAHLVLAADCVPFATPDLHANLLPGHAVVIGCPKFDDLDFGLERLTAILRESDILSLTVLHLQVPCCHGYLRLATQALEASGKDIPLQRVEISPDGRILVDTRAAATNSLAMEEH